METTKMTPDMEALKSKLRATWIAGDFGEIAKSIAAGGAEFVERLGLKPGTRVLDVACGTRSGRGTFYTILRADEKSVRVIG